MGPHTRGRNSVVDDVLDCNSKSFSFEFLSYQNIPQRRLELAISPFRCSVHRIDRPNQLWLAPELRLAEVVCRSLAAREGRLFSVDPEMLMRGWRVDLQMLVWTVGLGCVGLYQMASVSKPATLRQRFSFVLYSFLNANWYARSVSCWVPEAQAQRWHPRASSL